MGFASTLMSANHTIWCVSWQPLARPVASLTIMTKSRTAPTLDFANSASGICSSGKDVCAP